MKRLAFAFAVVLSSSGCAGGDGAYLAYSFGPTWYETGCDPREFDRDERTRAEAQRCA